MKKFWVENLPDLFCNFDVIPMKDMTSEEQMNSLTRIVLLIFILLFIIDFRYDFLFLGISLVTIIILYYVIQNIKMKKPIQENFGPVESALEPVPPVPWNTDTNDFIFVEGNTDRCGCNQIPRETKTYLNLTPNNSNPSVINTSDSLRWCGKTEIPFEQTTSLNQKLVGPANPKTFIQPVIPSPAYDYQTFAPNDFVVPTFLNEDRRQEMYQNGYLESLLPPPLVPDMIEGYEYQRVKYPSIDKACGYNPQNLKYNLPANYRPAPGQNTMANAEYNKNLYTIPLQPGLNTFNQINQPYANMSNFGISETPQFQPTTFDTDQNGVSTFFQHDPNVYQPPPTRLREPQYPLRNQIYDPRFTGYGSADRSYIDPMVGQPRFFYDDITSQTQPNYITRNNIDFTTYGQQIGPAYALSDSNQGYSNMDIRNMANNTYTDSVISQRTELQQRLMMKNSNREWQLRQMPISTQNTSRGGGGRSSGTNYSGPRG